MAEMTREEAARVLKYLWIERDENAKSMQQLTKRFFERKGMTKCEAYKNLKDYKENLYFAYCPICGKAYDDEEARHEE